MVGIPVCRWWRMESPSQLCLAVVRGKLTIVRRVYKNVSVSIYKELMVAMEQKLC